MPTDSPLMVALRTIMRVSLDRIGLLPYARRIQRDLFTLRQNRITYSQVEAIYIAQYHDGYGKTGGDGGGWESDEVIKLAHAKTIAEVLPDVRKVLVGGCSSGMGVLAFRQIGLDAWGFDISPDLDKIGLPEVRNYIRRGSMTCIPFGADDHFDCLVTTDVLEHVQLKDVERMFHEIARLECPWTAHLINHTAMTADHMTLKPLKWWAKQALPYYRLRSDLRAPETGNPRIYGLNGDPLHVYTFWEQV